MSLVADLSIDVFLTPESGTPGLNAVTAAEDFTLTGTADGYATGDGGQAVLQMSGSDTLTGESTFLSGLGSAHYLNGLHAESQFWIMAYWNPQGDTDTFQVLFQTTNAASAGYRMRVHGDGSSGQFLIHDGTSSVTLVFPVGIFGEWSGSGGNTILMQVDITNGTIESWINGRTTRTTSLYQKDISGLSWPAIGSPRANAIAPSCSPNGDFMVCSGTGILTDPQVEQLMRYGMGQSWAAVSSDTVLTANVNTWRATPGETTLQIVGCADSDPTYNIYPDTGRTTRGSLTATSGSLSRDTQGWASHTFTGLTADTNYKVHATYADGSEDVRYIRSKTLPSTRDAFRFAAAGCWMWDTALADSNALSAEFAGRGIIPYMADADVDVLVSTGDDGYYDTEWTTNELNAVGSLIDATEMQRLHEKIFNRFQLEHLFARVPFFHGIFSDHEYLFYDYFGSEATAGQQAISQAHLEQRFGVTYSYEPTNLYRSWQTPGLTWIGLDCRTESEPAVQKTSVAQRTQMQADMASAVARGDFIILVVEEPWDDGSGTPAAESWNHNAAFQAERADIFNRIVAAGATYRVISIHGDYHSVAVDMYGVQQGGWDDRGLCRPITVLASRVSHFYAAPSPELTFPDYFDNGPGGWILFDLVNNGDKLDVTVTPYQEVGAQTALTRTIGDPMVNSTWRGAVEPAESGASGNEIQLWRGAVEPAYVAPAVGGAGKTGPGLTFGMMGKMGA